MLNSDIKKGQAILITDNITRKYLSGISLEEGIILLTKDSSYYFTDARYFSAVKDEMLAKGFTPVLYGGRETLEEYLSANRIKSLLIDYERTTVAELNGYKSLVKRIGDCSKAIKEARAVKSEYELGCIKKSCAIIEKALSFARDSLKEGVTELEIAKVIEKKIIEQGGEGSSFNTIVAFGSNSSVPHHVTGETRLTKNSVVLIDTGARYKGYSSDITRTYYFGEPTAQFIKIYNAVLKANLLAEENIRVGMTGRAADAIARDYFKAQGLDKYFTHSLGHSLGLEIHEYPTLSPRCEGLLNNGMVFTVEPGLYIEDKEAFGVRIEDTVMLIGGKLERAFTDNKELIII